MAAMKLRQRLQVHVNNDSEVMKFMLIEVVTFMVLYTILCSKLHIEKDSAYSSPT